MMSEPAIGKWVSFTLAGEVFALRVHDVQEVMMAQPLTPVPLAPEHIVGLLNLRGQIMPAVDLRRWLHFAPREAGADSRLIVLKTHGESLSLVVDAIGDVLDLPEVDWRDPPDTLAARHRGSVVGICPIEGCVVLGLDVRGLLGDG
jgi:purine-binding chemotaxis protein CheW